MENFLMWWSPALKIFILIVTNDSNDSDNSDDSDDSNDSDDFEQKLLHV